MIFSKPLLAAVCLGAMASTAAAAPQAFSRHRDHVLGTSFDLVVMAETATAADKAEAAIMDEIDRLNAILSHYDAESEIARLNSKPKAQVSADLMRVLAACESFRKRSKNAMSCRIGKVIANWDMAETTEVLPDRASLRLMSGQAERVEIVLNEVTGAVIRPDAVVLRTDAVAKGYIIDKALEAGRKAAPEASGMLLNIGGDQHAWGAGPHDGKWRTGISSFSEAAESGPILSFAAGALATSGIGPRDRIIGGQHFGHIVSPADGWPVEGKLRTSVYAKDAMTADALATALMVMNLSEALSMIEGMQGVEAVIMADDGRTYRTSGWSALEVGAPAPPVQNDQLSWPEDYQLSVDIEIPELTSARYERPYVAVWIADADRNLTRILMLAGNESRWMEENYYWYRRFGRKAGSLVDAMSGPTRRPGVYTLVWDGRDDDGHAVPPGDYTLHIEAAREHGDHQHDSLDLPLRAGAFTKERPAGPELGIVRVRFGATE